MMNAWAFVVLLARISFACNLTLISLATCLAGSQAAFPIGFRVLFFGMFFLSGCWSVRLVALIGKSFLRSHA